MNKTVTTHLSSQSKPDFELSTLYGSSQPYMLTAGWLSCCYSRRATTQYVTSAVRPLARSVRTKRRSKGGRGRRARSATNPLTGLGAKPL